MPSLKVAGTYDADDFGTEQAHVGGRLHDEREALLLCQPLDPQDTIRPKDIRQPCAYDVQVPFKLLVLVHI